VHDVSYALLRLSDDPNEALNLCEQRRLDDEEDDREQDDNGPDPVSHESKIPDLKGHELLIDCLL